MAFNAGDIESKLDLDRSPFKKGMDQALADAKRMEARRINMSVHLDRKQLDALIADAKKKGIVLPVEENELRRYHTAMKQAELETEQSTKRMRGHWLKQLFQPVAVQFGLLPAVAATASALTAASMGIIAVASGAIGIALLKNNDRVADSFSSLWDGIQEDLTDFAGPMVPFLENISKHIGDAFGDWAPEISRGFEATGPAIQTFADGLIDMTSNIIPAWSQALQRSGPFMRGWQSLLGDIGKGFGEFIDEVSLDVVKGQKSVENLGKFFEVAFRGIGGITADFSGAWADVGDNIVKTLDILFASIEKITSGGMPAFVTTLTATLNVLNAILQILGPFLSAFGGMAGTVIGLAAAWKLLNGVVGIFAKTWTALSPATWAQKFAPAVLGVQRLGDAGAVMITKVSGSSAAGATFGSVIGRIGSIAGRVAANLPLVGAAVLGVKGAIDDWFPSAEKLAPALMKGGAAAEEAKKHLYGIADGYQQGSIWGMAFGTTAQEVREEISKQRAGMTALERAQMDAVQAQNDYQFAVDRFGSSSDRAKDAQEHYAVAVGEVDRQQKLAAISTETHTRAMTRQTLQMLGAIGARLDYAGALVDLEKKQKDLTDALAKHGPKSTEAREADIAYQQQLLNVVSGLGERVKAENASASSAEQDRLATMAMHQEIARLAVAAGTNLPPALAQMASLLSDAELAAMGVTREVGKTGETIYKLPPGKDLKFPTDAPVAQSQIQNLHTEIDKLPTQKNFTYLVNVQTGNVQSLPGVSLGGLLGVTASAPSGVSAGRRASGGPVTMGALYQVNETGREYFQPAMNGTVLTAEQTERSIARGWAGRNDQAVGSAGPVIDYGEIAAAMEYAVRTAMDGSKLRVDGQEWAQLVNGVNTANRRR